MTTTLRPADTLVDRMLAAIGPEHTIFLVSGQNGSGKTTFFRIAARSGFDVHIFQKVKTYQTRPGAVCDAFESIRVSREEFENRRQNPRFFTLRIMGEACGVYIDALQRACDQHQFVCCTIIQPTMIRRLRRELKRVRVVAVHIYADETRRAQRIATDNATSETPEYRHSRAPRLLARYRRAPFIYDHVILNVFDEKTYVRHVKALLHMYNAPQQGQPMQRNLQLERRNQECFV